MGLLLHRIIIEIINQYQQYIQSINITIIISHLECLKVNIITQYQSLVVYIPLLDLFIDNNKEDLMDRANVIDIYMDWNIGATGTQRHFTNQLKHYARPIISTNGQKYIDEASEYSNIHSIPTTSKLYSLKNKLETAAFVSIYNEDKDAVESTLKGVHSNLKNLPPSATYLNQDRQEVPKEKIAVFVIQDGILNCHETILDFIKPYEPTAHRSKLLARKEIIKYETDALKNKKREVNPTGQADFPWSIPKRTSLMYEINWRPEQGGQETLTVFFVFKHLNGKKLSSQAWFFEGFCRYLNPEFCVLLDVGTVPDQKGIANFVKQLKSDENIGGVSGFMNIDEALSSEGVSAAPSLQPRIVREYSEHNINVNQRQPVNEIPIQNKESCWKRMFWSIQKAQASQYIMAHFLDKNFESLLGFLHVLPGAWSAYRLSAMQTGLIYEQDIMQKKYFRTIINPNQELEAQEMMKTSNMYLAEDRILSLAIYCQLHKKYTLKYVPNAKACTDPMKTQADLALQRRRWINSSLYAFEYVLANYECDMANSTHGSFDRIAMHFNIFMSTLSFFNSSLIPCFFLFILFSTIRYNGSLRQLGSDQIYASLLAYIICIPYVIVVMVAIGGSMIGNIWINDVYERDGNGEVIMERKQGQESPKKRDGKKPKVNGNAAYITIIITIYNYVWLLAVSAFTIQLVVEAFKNNLDFKIMQIDQTISFLFLCINIGCSALLILSHLPTHPKEIWQLIIGFPSSVSFLSLYTHTMVIFSVCNVDDTSWGTKGSTGKQGKSDFSKQKSYFVGGWILKNAVVCFAFFMIDMYATDTRWITILIACYSTSIYAIKCILAVINQVIFLFKLCCKCKSN